MTGISLTLSTSGVDLLHFEPVLALWLSLREPALLEVDVGCIVHRAGAASHRALLLPEVGQHLGLDRLAARHLQLRVEVAAELGLGEAGGLEVSCNFPPDDIARFKHGGRVPLLAVKVDAAEVRICVVEAGLGRLGLLLRRSRGSRHGQAGELSLLEPGPGVHVRVTPRPTVSASLGQEPVDGVGAAPDGVTELALFENAPVDDLLNHVPDVGAVTVDSHVIHVDVVEVLLVGSDGLFRRGRRRV